jgi:WD40 repeat protein
MNTSARKEKAKHIRFKKGEIRIQCAEHPEETVAKVAQVGKDVRLFCLECLLDNPDYIKKHKQRIISVEQYFSNVLDDVELLRDNREDMIEHMPSHVKNFYDNYYTVRDTFRDLTAAEKSRIGNIFKETNQKIVDHFVNSGQELQEKLQKQLDRFNGNTLHFRKRIDENYLMEGLPSESEVLKNLNSKLDKELHTYMKDLRIMISKKDPIAYESMYDLLNHQIQENLKVPPKLVVDERIRHKLRKIEEIVKELLDDVVQDLKETVNESKVVDLSELSLEEARRGVSQDGLCGFMEFSTGSQKLSFKLHKKIMTNHSSNISCILNLGNNYIASGSRAGLIKIYQISTSQLVAEIEAHRDVVTAMCSLNPNYDTENLVLCAGSANLDGRIVVWDVFRKDKRIRELKGHQGNITALTSLGDGRTIASAAHDGNIIVWDTHSGQEMSRQLGHSSMISSMRYIPSRDALVSAGWDSNIKVWNIVRTMDEGQSIAESLILEKVILADSPIINILARQLKGNYVVTVGANGSMKVWNLETEDMEGEFRASENNAEVCLLENKFKFGSADFITLNTSVREERNFDGNSTGMGNTINTGSNGFEMSSFFTQPKVQLIQNNKQMLRMIKVINHAGESHSLNVYEII